MAPRQLLIVNPNTDRRVTAWLAAEARRVTGTTLMIDAVNADSGLAAIATPEDALHASRAVVDTVDAHPDHDAVLIGAFGDPGLAEVRRHRRLRTAVGLGEAGLRAVAAGGRSFAIVTLGSAMEAPLRARCAALGLGDQLRALRILPVAIGAYVASRSACEVMLAAAIEQSFVHDAAEAVLLGGAPFAGLAQALASRFDKPIFDGVAAAVDALRGGFGASQKPNAT